jgi:spermidine/putrescine transport system permease protein
MLRRISPGWALIALPSAWLLVFFLVPLALMAGYSLRPDMRGDLFALDWQPTFAHYLSILGNGSYIRLLGISVGVASLVALFAIVLAYPLAYFLAFRAGGRASLYLTLLILPFWTSYLLRIIAWKIILGPSGLLNNLLLSSGLLQEPLRLLLYSRTAVVITLIYVWLPFVALPIYAALQRIDRSVLEAASILGAPPPLAFLRVTLPLSMPGVIAAFFMVFIPTMGEYVTPLLVGGSSGSLYGNIIQTFFSQGLNWPLGAAMAFIMLAGALLLSLILTRIVDASRILG